MPGEATVEERLERARLLPRIGADVLSMCKSVDTLLHAQHSSNLAQAVNTVQEIARDNFAVVVALKWVVMLVDMLEADAADVRLAACNALAAVSVAQEGRDAVRSAGGLRPLVSLLSEGSRSPVAAAAASAIMNCSACDVCKEAIADCRAVPLLLTLIKEAVQRCSVNNPPASSAGSSILSPSPSVASSVGSGSGALGGKGASGRALAGGGGSAAAAASGQDLRSPGECRAAVYAAGALMNMGGVISVQEKMLEAGAIPTLESTLRISTQGDVVATRANFMLSWLAVARGGIPSPGHRHTSERERRAAALAAAQQQQQGHLPSPSPRGGTPQSVSSSHRGGGGGSAPASARSTASGATPPDSSGNGLGGVSSGPGSQHPWRVGSPAGGGRAMAGSPAVGLRSSAPATPGSAVGSSKAAALAGHA